jgi:predicted ATPase/transcriptional regulator with XRE-family HTH domain
VKPIPSADGEGDAVADDPGASLAVLLKRLRRAARLTQEELAEAAQISVRAVSDLERGVNRTARKDTVRLLADALGLAGEERELFEATALGRAPAGQPRHDQPRHDQPRHDQPRKDRSGPGAPGQLPVALTPLVGRADDVREICGWLRRPEVRLVTITGLGGVGKTRTALDIGKQLAPGFPDGVIFVNLAAVRDSELVLASIAWAAGVRDSGPEPLAERVAGQLRPLRVLLIIDNFEQVVDAAQVVSDLLSTCLGLSCLVTSRCALRLSGEHEYVLAPLRLPPAASKSASELLGFPSVELFAQRVQSILPNWTLDENSGPAVGEICRRLDGLPLALELAAARTKILAPVALLERLGGHQDVLSRGRRDASARHQTLRATLDWSYELLDAGPARLFPQLAVFADGWTIDTMMQVCDVGDDIETLDALAALVDNSLVWRTGAPAAPRFLLPVTIREYADGKLRRAGLAHDVARRHLAWCLDLAETAAGELAGASQLSWLRLLADEHANLRAALEHAITTGESSLAHRLGAALWRYWEINGHVAEGRQWLGRILVMTGPTAAAIRAQAFKAAGNLARDQGDFGVSIDCQRHAYVLFREAGDRAGMAAALNNMGTAELDHGDVAEAVAHFRASLEQFAAAGDRWGVAIGHNNLARALRTGTSLVEAEQAARESLVAFEHLGDPRGTGRALTSLALIVGRAGDLAQSLDLLAQAAVLFAELGDRAGLAHTAEAFAWAKARLGHAAVAVWLLGHTERLREEVGAPLNADDRIELDDIADRVRPVLAPRERDARRTAGYDTELDDVLDVIRRPLTEAD